MKILYIGSVESIHLRRWVSFFAEKGHEVHALDTGAVEEKDKPKNVKIHQIPERPFRLKPLRRFLRYVELVKGIRRLIDELEPDLIHVHYIDHFALAAVASGFRPLVTTAWGSDVLIHPKRSLPRWFLARKVIRYSDLITCDAEHMRQALVRFGAKYENVKLVYFGTDLTQFNPGKKESKAFEKIGLANKYPVIISLRALKPIYNVETFVRAIPLVLKRHPDTGFVIVGGGSEEQMLKDLCNELGVTASVRFTGRVSDQDLQLYTASADIYVSTSLSDAGLAASTAEAMACQVPVVITDFGDNRIWVKEGESGLLFPLRDHQGLAEKLNYLIDKPEEAARLALGGMKVIEETNNWHKEMEKMNRIYSDCPKP